MHQTVPPQLQIQHCILLLTTDAAVSLQCFNTVSQATGRSSGLSNPASAMPEGFPLEIFWRTLSPD